MTKTFIIRHAEAEGNLYRRGQGHFDGKITPLGQRQIDALAERFKDERIDALYSSDMSRTKATAGAILRYRGLPLNTDSRLREIDMGAWEDTCWGNIAESEPEMLHNFNCDPDNWRVCGGESFQRLQRRITDAVLDIASRHNGQTIVIVSHGMAIRSLMCAFLGIPSGEAMSVAHCDNTAVALVNVGDGGAQIIYRGDNSHLTGDLSSMKKQLWWKSKSGYENDNLRIVPLRFPEEIALYADCYRQAWRAAHGAETGFDPAVNEAAALKHAATHPLALMKAYRGSGFAGIIELDTERGKAGGYGWITLCALTGEHRGKGLGIQLIGHAASVYRHMGMKTLRLHVSEKNRAALGFYKKYGFCEIGREAGAHGDLILMEKPI
jgi:probable phosphoglycerate mutase